MKITNKKPKEDQIYYYKDGKCVIASDELFDEELMSKCGNPEAKTWAEHDAILNPPPTNQEVLDKCRTSKLDEMYRTCGEKIDAGIQTDVVHGYMVHYRLNGHDQLGIDAASRRASGGKIWRNDVYEQHSQVDAIAIQELKDSHVESCKLTYYNKRTYLLSESRTAEEIEAVTWDSAES